MIKQVLLLAIFLGAGKVWAMKLRLTEEQREIFKRIGKAGGLAGSREKKRASALNRWAKVKAGKSISRNHAGE